MKKKRVRISPEAQESPRKGYFLEHVYDHERDRVTCWFCLTSIRYEHLLRHEITGKQVGVGSRCAEALTEPYSIRELSSDDFHDSIEDVRKALEERVVHTPWLFKNNLGDDCIHTELVPFAIIFAKMNHRGFYDVSLKNRYGRLIYKAYSSDPTDLEKMRRQIFEKYMAYAKNRGLKFRT